MAQVPPDEYTLLLYHYPDRADIAADHGVDVFLAGDTHGGQVRLPVLGSIAAPRWRNPFIMGRYQVGETTLLREVVDWVCREEFGRACATTARLNL